MLTGSVRRNFQNLRYFRCPVWKIEKLIKSKPTQKLKHANSILEYFEYFGQISSKSILIILSYTVSKLVRFFETQCRHAFRSSIGLEYGISTKGKPTVVYRNFEYVKDKENICRITAWYCRFHQTKRIYNNRRPASCKVLLDWNMLERRSIEISMLESRGVSVLIVSQKCCCCFDFILTFLHCEFDALCHHFNKAFMYVCMYVCMYLHAIAHLSHV